MINKVFFLGSKKLGYSVLKEMYNINQDISRIITYNDKADKRSYLEEFEEFSLKKKIVLNILDKPSELFDLIEEEVPDLVIVAGWYWIIPIKILEIVRKGFIGIHGSLLPSYRGFAPFVWALLNGEKETGLSLFYFSDGIDTGDIIAQKKLTINDNTKIANLLSQAEEKSIELIRENYGKILNEKNSRTLQLNTNVSYCSIRKPEDGLIDWNDTNVNIHNFIRAQSDPYPGAFSYIEQKKYFIVEAKLVNDTYYGTVGVIAEKNPDSIIVCCGKNAIEIIQLREENNIDNIVGRMKFGKKFINRL